MTYKNHKVTHTFALENTDCCEVSIKLKAHGVHVASKEEHFIYDLTYRNQHESKTQTMVVADAASKGQASLIALNRVIQKVENVPYKNVSIYYNNDYAVKVFNEIGVLLAKGRIDTSPNKVQILEMAELKKTVGHKHYITVKKEKIIKTYGKQFHE